MIELTGMTWEHERGFSPMVATAREYERTHPGVRIHWEQRSLQAFADFPVDALAEKYDLLVIDHPHMGDAARGRYLLALDEVGRSQELKTLAGAVGRPIVRVRTSVSGACLGAADRRGDAGGELSAGFA